MGSISRRDFLITAGTATGALAAGNALAWDLLRPVLDPLGAYPYRGWEALYQDQWTYDSFGRSTHGINCTGSCTWKGYVKNGILFKEEQYADYPDINTPGEPGYDPALPDLPTINPRGCQKGAHFKEYIYGPQRPKYPLIRVGERGEGRWRRASWNEALSYIADKVAANISAFGPDTITFYSAIPAKHHLTLAGGFRLANLIGGVVCSFYDWYCDLPPGEPLTWGVQTDACESADWFNSKYIMLMGANLLETRIPDAHVMTEARMNGTKIVSVFPEYNPVSIHADEYIAIKPGTDGALCLAMANVIVEQGLYDAPYIKQFTDMPFLVRTDTNTFLRESDVVAGGSSAKFYVWDTVTASALLAPGSLGFPAGDPNKTLDLGLVDPALEGNFTVSEIPVTTVFSVLRQKLADHSPLLMAPVTGIDATTIVRLAEEFAASPAARIIEGAGTNHYYHNDLINRSQILLVALTGNVGKPGGGFDHYVGQEKLWAEQGFFRLSFPHGRPKQRFQNTTLWTYTHADVTSDVDGQWPRSINSYVAESVANGWMPLWPKGTITPGDPRFGLSPKVLFVWGANYLNQAKGFLDVYTNLWPKLDLIVDLNFRMDTTALHADVVLPAATWFEMWNINTTDLHSYVIPMTPVIPPQFESRTDWQIWQGLADALAATGLSFSDTVPDGTIINRNFASLGSDFRNFNTAPLPAGAADLSNDKDACQFLLNNSPEFSGLTMDDIAAQPARLAQTSEEWTSDLLPNRAYYGFQRMTEHLRPLTTLTGRQQFYIDHDWYVNELGEELPVYKPPVDVDVNGSTLYPLRWITPHGRWSIHSTYRDCKFQLRMQRGRPIVYLSPAEATARGLLDNDAVEVFNGHGSLVAHLCVSSRLPDGMAQMYHGWESYMLKNALVTPTFKNGWQGPCTIRIKPTQLIGGYGHVNFRLNYWGPTGNQKDTRVDIRKYNGTIP
ncbi:MAG: molybdopterin-dependent oxidoreductase [Syntrophobacteraceae bacterium]